MLNLTAMEQSGWSITQTDKVREQNLTVDLFFLWNYQKWSPHTSPKRMATRSTEPSAQWHLPPVGMAAAGWTCIMPVCGAKAVLENPASVCRFDMNTARDAQTKALKKLVNNASLWWHLNSGLIKSSRILSNITYPVTAISKSLKSWLSF